MKLLKLLATRLLYGLNPFSAQTSLPWGGTVTGDAGPYTDDQWSDTWRKIFTRDRTVEGVFPDYLGELVVTNPSGTTIRTASGGAIVDGKFYENTANVDNTVVIPGAGSNFYTIVLEKDFTAQTVRISMLGPDVSAPPAVTQVDGTTWEIALAEIEVPAGGGGGGTGDAIVTDVREFCHYNTEVSTAMIANDAITAAKILDGTITNAKLATPVEANTIAQDGASGDLVCTNSPTLVPGCTASKAAGTYLVIGTFTFLIQGTAGQYAHVKGQLYSDSVLQSYETTYRNDIDASGNEIRICLTMTWSLTLASTVTVQLRAYAETGSTATATVVGTVSKINFIKIA